MEVACFEVRGQVFGIDVQQIREVVRGQDLAPLPKSPPLIEGLMDLRGALLPVIDLGRALELGPVRDERKARIAIVEVSGLALGLRVDAATEVLGAEDVQVETPTTRGVKVGTDAIRTLLRRDGAPPVLVLDLEALVASLWSSSEPRERGGS